MSHLDELDNFFLEGDLDDDPFASPKDSNKRKSPGDVNVDEEVSVTKKARVPRIKLDQERLLSQKGIPALRKRARDLKFKGKGHEWGDASRLLSFYQGWLDDLFPKAKFLDALAMVEKAGHNRKLQIQRVDWINEGKPKITSVLDEGGDAADGAEATGDAAQTRMAPIFDKPASGARRETPEIDDLFGDEDDIYNASPVAGRKNGLVAAGDEPDEDELDALMAMDQASGPTKSSTAAITQPSAPAGAMKSLFGNGKAKPTVPPAREQQAPADDFDDWEALMAEAEDEPPRQKTTAASTAASVERPSAKSGDDNEDDDLDALMAEAEGHSETAKRVVAAAASAASTAVAGFDDDEEAMAEMDGLW